MQKFSSVFSTKRCWFFNCLKNASTTIQCAGRIKCLYSLLTQSSKAVVLRIMHLTSYCRNIIITQFWSTAELLQTYAVRKTYCILRKLWILQHNVLFRSFMAPPLREHHSRAAGRTLSSALLSEHFLFPFLSFWIFLFTLRIRNGESFYKFTGRWMKLEWVFSNC